MTTAKKEKSPAKAIGTDDRAGRKLTLAKIGWGIGLAVWVGAILFGVQFLISFILVKMLSESQLQSNVLNSIYQVVVYAASFAVIVFVPWRILKMKTTRDELGLRGLPTWTDVLLAPIGFIVVMALATMLSAIMVAIMPDIDWEQAQEVGFNNLYNTADFILAFVCLVVLAPICEEIIFRGWLYGKLRMRLSAVPAILIVSVLFGVMHGQWNVGVTVFAMSVGMCVMRELTGTVWSGVLLHMIKNGIAFYFLFVAA
jgi:membrane protease YdiL (CAAX protease family)